MNIIDNSEFIQTLNSYQQNLYTVSQTLPKLLQQKELKQLKLPNLDNNDIIDIYYLEAPLGLLNKHLDKTNITDTNLYDINSYHTGVGFIYRKSNIQLVLDYAAYDFRSVFFPTIENDSIQWNNKTYVGFYEYIDTNYWTKSSYVGQITHKHLKEIINWCYYFNKHNYMYVMFACYELLSKNIDSTILNQKPFLRNSICDTFCFEMFKFISKIGGQIKYILPLRETFASIFIKNNTNSHKKLDINNSSDKQTIINYYQNIANLLSNVLNKFIPDIKNLFNNIKNPGEILTFISNIMKDTISIGQIISNIHQNLNFYIYYGFDKQNNKPTYYILYPQKILINYVISNLERNVSIKDINKELVIENQIVIENYDNKKKSNYILYVILGIIILIIIIWFCLIRKKLVYKF
jgi:hypothetical protein